MGKLLKILFSLLLTVVLLIGIAAVVLPQLIDPEDIRTQLSKAGSEATGREFELEGDLSLSVFPWLGFEVGRLRLGNAEGFAAEDMAVIDEAMVKVKLMPLLSRRIEISEVVLKGMQLNLAKNQEGVGNWEDLAKAAEKASEPKDVVVLEDESEQAVTDESSETDQSSSDDGGFQLDLASVSIGGIAVENAKVSWLDATQNQEVTIQDLDLTTEEIRFDSPINFEMAMLVDSATQGISEKLNMTGSLTVNQALDHFELKELSLTSVTTGEQIPNGELKTHLATALDVNLANQRVSITGLQLTAADELVIGADLIGTQILESPSITGPITITNFSPRALMKKLNLTIPETSDASVLGKASGSFNLKADQKSASLEGIQLTLDDTSIAGNVNVSDFTTQATDFDFDIDAINVDRYLPPTDDSEGTSASTQSSSKTGNTTTSEPVATQPNATSTSSSQDLGLPMEMLRKLNLNGTVDIGSLQAAKAKMQTVNLKVSAKDGQIKTDQSVGSFYQGTIKSTVNMDARSSQPAFTINETVKSVAVGDLLQDMKGEQLLSGTANINTALNTSGNSVDALKAALSGTLSVDVADGVLNGFNFTKVVRDARDSLKSEACSEDALSDSTAFEAINYQAVINKGLVTTKALSVKATGLDISGKGTANLVSEKLDHNLTITMEGSLADSTCVKIKELEALKGVPIAMKVSGTFSEPSTSLDLSSMLNEKKKQVIEEKKDELKEKAQEKRDELAEDLEEKVPGAGELLKKLPFFQ